MEGTCPYPPPILANQIGDQIDPKLGIDQAGREADYIFSPSPCNVLLQLGRTVVNITTTIYALNMFLVISALSVSIEL